MVLVNFWRSVVGKKIIVAVSGFFLFAFVIAHMLGNLQVFLGSDPLNAYAKLLKASPELLWTMRIGLLFMTVLHVVATISLWRLNRAARPVGYLEKKSLGASIASRTMTISGLIVLGFIVFHLMHFTIGAIEPSYLELRDELGRHDVYRMVILGFQNPYISGFYILSVGLLSLHLSHGFASLFRSLGLSGPVYRQLQEKGSVAFGLAVFVGMSIVPIAVLAGWVS